MSSEDITHISIGARSLPAERTRMSLRRYWLSSLLFLATLWTTTIVGARLAENFHANAAAFDIENDLAAFGRIAVNPAHLASGLPFSLTLLTILLAHELGHYLACVYYRIDATPPYFIPAPTVIGTFGAFIRIRSPIYSKRTLFDIGIAGPLAGFAFVIPALGVGIACSKILPGIAERGDLLFGTPPIVRAFELLVFPGTQASDIYWHPVARAAWVGVIATALNLLPIGQADGGHIVYAMFGSLHRFVSRALVVVLVPLGFFFWYGWLLWAAIFVVFGMRHPPTIYDERALGRGRRMLGWLAFAILLLSFTLTPIRTGPGV